MTTLRRFSTVALAFLLTLATALPVSAGSIINSISPILSQTCTTANAIPRLTTASTTAAVFGCTPLTSDGTDVTLATGRLRLPDGTAAATALSGINAPGAGLIFSASGNISIVSASAVKVTSIGDPWRMASTVQFGWVPDTDTIGTANDLVLIRAAAANLKQGLDAAAPVSQYFSVANVAAGTSDTAGAHRYIDGSQGRGTGAGGSIIFRTAAAGGAGSGLNALADLLNVGPTNVTLASGQHLGPTGTAALPTYGFTDQAGMGMYRSSDGVLSLAVSSAAQIDIRNGNVDLVNSAHLRVLSDAGQVKFGAGADIILARAAAATPYFYGSSTAVGATVRLGNTNVGYEDLARNSEAHTLAAAGTSTTATAVWPANSSSLAATFRITTEITGCTSVQVGVAGDATRYGTFSTLTAGQTIAIGRIDNYAAQTGILFTAVGGGASFTAGVIRVNLRYVTASAPTS